MSSGGRGDPNLDVFARGLPLHPNFFSGFKKKHDEVEMTMDAMKSTLRGIEVRPGTLQENLRANIFPDVIESVVFSIKSTLFDMNLDQVQEYEALDKKMKKQFNGKAFVTNVANVDPQDSIIPYGIMHRGATMIGSEVWTVDRRDQFSDSDKVMNASKYRVNYYTSCGGDFFYTDVLPNEDSSVSQWLSFAWIRGNKFIDRMLGDSGAQKENVQSLPQPPKRN